MSSTHAVRFLSVEDVLRIHQDTLEHEGGLQGLRDAALLESAVLMPQQTFDGRLLHEDLPAMAAAYLYHLAQNHPSHDGNKRTAALTALVFLSVNGHPSLPAPDDLEEATLSVATSRRNKTQLTDWMRRALGDR